MTTPNEQPWEEEFDNCYTRLYETDDVAIVECTKSVKDFIRSKLSAEREVGRNEAVEFIARKCPQLNVAAHSEKLYVGVLEEYPEGTYFQIVPNTVLEQARTNH